MVQMTRAGPVQSQEPGTGTPSAPPIRMWPSRNLGRPPLLSQVHEQAARSEMGFLGPELTVLLDTSNVSTSLLYHALTLGPTTKHSYLVE